VSADAKPIAYHTFCRNVLHIDLTPAQEVLARCAFGDEDPKDLPEELRGIAAELFGGVQSFPAFSRTDVTLTLGRGSGKTTMSAAYALYKVLTADLSAAKHGHVPLFPLLSFDRDMATVALTAVRGFIDEAGISRMIVKDRDEEIVVKRHDGRKVGIKVFAPSKSGKTVRGRPIVSYLIDEAQFLNPSDDGKYVVNDKDIVGALTPRLLPGGKGIFISTPWPTPTPTVMRELHDKNFGNPQTAVSALGTTLMMRGDDPHVQEIVRREFERDPETARRELECDDSGTAAGSFFDPSAINSAVSAEFPIPRNKLWSCAVGVDLAFRRDSTAIVVVQWDGNKYITSKIVEMNPTRDAPLKPSDVFDEIARVCKEYSVSAVITDGHYREALHEHLSNFRIAIINAPDGVLGKEDAYVRARAVLHQGLVSLPPNDRMHWQLKTIVARPTAGGHISIKAPRTKGGGHGDMVSAWVNALHYLTYAKVGREKDAKLKPGDPGYATWLQKIEMDRIERAEAEYLRKEDSKLIRERKRTWYNARIR
jgi:hypothetical protein